MLTNAKGGVDERRSYDPFGQRRNPVWGQPPPASFTSKTTKGFTGHEGDDELGLVNMRGRIFDPKLGRFLTTDPIVPDLYSGQSFNAYGYVLNNPLSFIDPSGFSEEPAGGPGLAPGTYRQLGPDGAPEIVVVGEKEGSNTSAAVELGATTPPTDVDTTGSSAGYETQPATTAPEDWRQNPYVQVEGGFLAGIALGMVPFGGVGQQVLDAADVLPHGTPAARRGLAVGQMVGGLISLAGGFTGSVLGGLASTTGIGAALGVPAVAVSTTLVVGGAANVAAGIRGLAQSMMSSGSGSSGPPATPTTNGGARPNTLQPGPHAGESIPARGPQRNFTRDERAKINEFGRDTGCHTCGTNNPGTKSGNFVPDHQPPTKVNPPGTLRACILIARLVATHKAAR